MLSNDTAAYDDLCERTEPSDSYKPGDRSLSPSGLVLSLARAAEEPDTVVCTHDLIEVLSVNGRILDAAVRQCAGCGERVR